MQTGAPDVSLFGSPAAALLATGSTLPSSPQVFPARDRVLATAFRSPATVASFKAPIPGSTVQTCCFAPSPAASAVRSVVRLGCPNRLAPTRAASQPLTRYSVRDPLANRRFQPPLPFGTITSLRIKAFNWSGNLPARLPMLPDLPSLPAAGFYL